MVHTLPGTNEEPHFSSDLNVLTKIYSLIYQYILYALIEPAFHPRNSVRHSRKAKTWCQGSGGHRGKHTLLVRQGCDGRAELGGRRSYPSVQAQGCPTGGGVVQAGLEKGGKTDSVKRRFGILLYSVPCYAAAWMGGEFRGEWILVYLLCIPLLLIWNYHNINSLAIPQYKIKS